MMLKEAAKARCQPAWSDGIYLTHSKI